MLFLLDEKGHLYLVKGDKDLHTKYGIVRREDLKNAKPGDMLKSHLGVKFYLIEPRIIDFLKKCKRGPQAITLKDCALIAAYSGIKSGSKVVDAGTGSGILAMFLANIVYPEKLVTYEIREDFAMIARENFSRFGISNIEIKLKNIYDGIDEKNLDLITLDLPEPWRVIPHAKKALKIGGFLVSYSPSISQVKKFCDSLSGFVYETIECLTRQWNIETMRPYSRMLGHTGFITFARLLER
ncbi:MAG TPA: tRNA (adenine-N1)-methyltransferase [Candidatus Altiarchaeales archaeon]|nr:MAG: tRNA (adenine-N1)-methyltransferase [Candidatus Altiarchaeales archaeon]HDN83560.1 tRNA (adenine-N1)-methyltransferase [Candidatus Altiarchaeales archaeon]